MKRLIAFILISLLLVSCSPAKKRHDYSEPIMGDESTIVVDDDCPYTPKTIYSLNADTNDFLDQSFCLPYYADMTDEQLESNFENSMNSFHGPGSMITAILPETVVFLYGQFAYDKKNGTISRTCKDPQCRHSTLFTEHFGACKLISGIWLICGDKAYSSTIDFTKGLVTTVFTTDFLFDDPHYASLPKDTVVECLSEDGRLILRKEKLVPYIDENGAQRMKQGDFEILLYNTETAESSVAFAPGSVFLTYPYKNDLFVTIYPEYTTYAFSENCSKQISLGKVERFAALSDKKVFYIDMDSKELMCYDKEKCEISVASEKLSFLTDMAQNTYSGSQIYCIYACGVDKSHLDLFDESQAADIRSFAEKSGVNTVYTVLRCGYDTESIELVYLSSSRISEVGVDGKVIYMNKILSDNTNQFTAYDMSSGVELQILLPYPEEHYPGEYDYRQNWRNGFN